MPEAPKTHAQLLRERFPAVRRKTAARGYDARWQRFVDPKGGGYRARYPLCKHCLDKGLYVASEVVDHIIPMAQGGAKYDEENLQALCKSCHDKKTAKENRCLQH
jgi:5-methylcytosine-specific restriction protein A